MQDHLQRQPQSTKKTIVRSKTGCYTCRKRKRKCDEAKPACGPCVRLGKVCENYQQRFEFRNENPKLSGKPHQSSKRQDHGIAFEHPSECYPLTDVEQSSPVFGPISVHVSPGSHMDAKTPSGHSGSPDSSSMSTANDLQYAGSPWPLEILSHNIDGYSFQPERERGQRIGQRSEAHGPDTFDADEETKGLSERPEVELEYFKHWKSVVSGVVSPVFCEIDEKGDDFPAARSALLALSACHLSQSQPTVNRIRCGEVLKTMVTPNQHHQLMSRTFYNKAIQQLSENDRMGRAAEAPMVFATLVIFSHIELNSGSFNKFSIHLSGIRKLLSAGLENILSTSFGSRLLISWINLQAQHWWNQTTFTQWGFYKAIDMIGQRTQLIKILSTPDCKREYILLLLCETRRLNILAYMEQYLGQDDRESLVLRVFRHIYACLKRPIPVKPERPILPDISGGYLGLLEKQEQKLEDWHANLSTADLPMESFTTARLRSMFCATSTTATTTKTTLTTTSSETTTVSSTTVTEKLAEMPVNVHPLKFSSHGAAMTYAYYAGARMMQSTSLLLEQTRSSKGEGLQPSQSTPQIDPWMFLLLRICAGLDPGTCARRNCYTVGITDLLIEAAHRSPDAAVLSFITQWAERVQAADIFQEGGNMTSLSLDLLTKIKDERAQGRYIYHIFGDPPSGNEWSDTCTSSAYLGSLVMLGKDIQSGQLFSRVTIV